MDHHQYLKQSRYLGLDGLRCISIIAVIWHHTGYSQWKEFYLASQGPQGVTLFFVISGFLITSLLLSEKAKYGTVNLKRFYIRRTLRIFPLYYTVLALYILLVLVVEPDTTVGNAFFSNLKYYATYTSNIFVPLVAGERIIFYFVWSLAVEEQFYLIWPTVEKILPNNAIIGFIIFVILAMFLLNMMSMDNNSFGHTLTKVITIPICFGVLLAHLLHNKNTYNMITTITRSTYSSVVYLLLMILSLSFPQIPVVFVYLTMTFLIASCVTHTETKLGFFLENIIVKKIGQISYGMYLLHMLAYNTTKKMLSYLGIDDWLVIFLVTVIMTIIAALISFNFFESYFLTLKKKFSVKTN